MTARDVEVQTATVSDPARRPDIKPETASSMTKPTEFVIDLNTQNVPIHTFFGIDATTDSTS